MLGGGDDDRADAGGDLASLEDRGGGGEVREASVRAGTDYDLVDLHVAGLRDCARVGRQVREGDGGLQLREVDRDGAGVGGVRIGGEDTGGLGVVRLQIAAAGGVHGEDAVLGAGLDGHVGDCQAVVHREGLHAGAGEFERHVTGAIDADEADQVEDQVLARDMLLELAGEDDVDRLGHLEPGLAGGHAVGGVRGPNAGGECAEGAVGAGMAVGADHAVAGGDESLFREEGVFDAAVVADLEVVLHLLVTGEGAHAGALLGGLDVLVGGEVVRDERDLRAVEHLRGAEGGEGFDGDGGGDVVREDEVEFRHHEFAGVDFLLARVGGEDFLGHCHVHGDSFKSRGARRPSTLPITVENRDRRADHPGRCAGRGRRRQCRAPGHRLRASS